MTALQVPHVRIELIPAGDYARYGVPETETFCIVASNGEVLGTDEDVPLTIGPVKFGRRLAEHRQVPLYVQRGLVFSRDERSWGAVDSRTCFNHGTRGCSMCPGDAGRRRVGPQPRGVHAGDHRPWRCGKAGC